MKRINVHLPESAIAELEVRAQRRGEPVGRIAAHLLCDRLDAGPRSLQQPPRTAERPPSWLPDYEDLETWKAVAWGEIITLHERYPEELSQLREGWWHRTSWVECLSAIAAWRLSIDAGADDPRAELFFHAALEDFASMIAREPTRAAQPYFEPGPPPPDWLDFG